MALSPKFHAAFDAFKKAVEEAEKKLRTFDDGAKRVEEALSRMAETKDAPIAIPPLIETLCVGCGEPVLYRSMAGDTVCPWCDMGKCRYCGVRSFLLKESIDGGSSLRKWREHMVWHRSLGGR